MKKFKRILSTLLAMTAALSMAAPSVHAAPGENNTVTETPVYTLQMDKYEVHAGDVVTFDWKVDFARPAEKGITGFLSGFDYDPAVFEYVSTKPGELMPMIDHDRKRNRISASLFCDPLQSGGKIGSIKFKVKDTASGYTDIAYKKGQMIELNPEDPRGDSVIMPEGIKYKITDKYGNDIGGKIFINEKLPQLESIRFDYPNPYAIPINERHSLRLVGSPENALGEKEVTWTSSNNDILSIVGNDSIVGLEAKKNGRVTVTATVEGKTASIDIIVKTPLEKFTFTKTTNTMYVGRTRNMDLDLDIKPTTASIDEIIWDSSNKEVATIDDKGVLRAHKTGTTIVSATAEGKTTTCEMRVVGFNELNGMTMKESDVRIFKGESKRLLLDFKPIGTDFSKYVTWSSSNETSATVDSNGVVTGHHSGVATITATTGNLTATCRVEVNSLAEKFYFRSEELKIGPDYTEFDVDVAVEPADAVYERDIKWTVSDDSVASIRRNSRFGAHVTMKRYADFTITAELDGKIATLKVKRSEIPLIPLEPSTPVDPKPEKPEIPLIPLEPSTPVDPKPEKPEIPLTPLEPSTPVDPKPEKPEIPLTPLEPSTPVDPKPEKPEIPLTPLEPSTPVDPKPEKPEIPLTPLEPSTPVDPKPEKPEIPLTPLEPSTPVDPKPEKPEIPLTPLEPSTPVDPKPEKPEIPLIPLEPSTPVDPKPETVDKSKLQAKLTECEKLKKDDYTSDSWKAMEKALKSAKVTLENKDATQAEVDKAIKVLSDAKKGLVVVKGLTPLQPSKPVEKPQTENKPSAPATGDPMDMMFAMSGMMGSAYVLLKSRKRK